MAFLRWFTVAGVCGTVDLLGCCALLYLLLCLGGGVAYVWGLGGSVVMVCVVLSRPLMFVWAVVMGLGHIVLAPVLLFSLGLI